METVNLDRALRMFKPFTAAGLMVRVRLRKCARWDTTKDTFRTLRQRQRFYPSYWKKMPKKAWNNKLASMMPTGDLHEQMNPDWPHQQLVKKAVDLWEWKS